MKDAVVEEKKQTSKTNRNPKFKRLIVKWNLFQPNRFSAVLTPPRSRQQDLEHSRFILTKLAGFTAVSAASKEVFSLRWRKHDVYGVYLDLHRKQSMKPIFIMALI